ncbi:MAG: beta-ketoacyl-[acyl-carrier-protein] synthase II [Gemmatimonadetes bacterium]|nr:MAG: beta-ketoacyl-[acyl-carrier-protein] synthase II [Gemmatimonadota bacterium]
MTHRVVITGVGAITPVGLTASESMRQLCAGCSGIAPITHFDASALASRIAGEVKNFDPTGYLDQKIARRIGRYAQFAIVAAQEAQTQAQWDITQEEPTRVASLVASAIGDFPLLEQQMKTFLTRGPGKMNPFTVSRVSSSMAAGNISLHFGVQGASYGVSSACSTGSHSLATAWMLLRLGLADVAVAGGTEAAISASFQESYITMRALSTRNDAPQQASRPFDKDRDGFVIGEGCGVLILETLKHAQRRGAPILAELAGVGMTCDAYHLTANHPEGRGAAQAMRMALQTAGLAPEQIDYINAHGTSTPMNDPIETQAIKTVFGEAAYRIPVSSIKSMIGHCIGASGAIEAVVCVMALQQNIIPPTINLDEPDARCDLDYVPHQARHADLNFVMSNSFAFGGQNCVLIFRKFTG